MKLEYNGKIYNLRPGFIQDSNRNKCSPITHAHTVIYDNKNLDNVLDDILESIEILKAAKTINTIDITIKCTDWVFDNGYYKYRYYNNILSNDLSVEVNGEAETLYCLQSEYIRWVMADTECGNGYVDIYTTKRPTKNLKFTLVISTKYPSTTIHINSSDWIKAVDDANLYKYTYTNNEIKNNMSIYCTLDLKNALLFASEQFEGGFIYTENINDGSVDIYCDVQFEGNIILSYYRFDTQIPI